MAAARYQVDCDCGKTIPVELYQAGASVDCPNCRESVSVPDSITLKQSAGDKYAVLSPLQKIIRTSESSEPPFDGACHGCTAPTVEFEVPIKLQVLIERDDSDVLRAKAVVEKRAQDAIKIALATGVERIRRLRESAIEKPQKVTKGRGRGRLRRAVVDV